MPLDGEAQDIEHPGCFISDKAQSVQSTQGVLPLLAECLPGRCSLLRAFPMRLLCLRAPASCVILSAFVPGSPPMRRDVREFSAGLYSRTAIIHTKESCKGSRDKATWSAAACQFPF